MSGDESECSTQHKRKRKVRRLSDDSSESTSSGSPIIGASSSRRRRVAILREESSESESSDCSDVFVKRKKVGRVQSDSESSTSSSSIPVRFDRSRNRAYVLESECESSPASSLITRQRRNRNVAPLSLTDMESDDSQWESDFSDSGNEVSIKAERPSTSAREEKAVDSDSSDGQLEKCPICLISFRLQEVGVPENCEHSFCLECIQEWSKNMNTCPVDRKEYSSISVKKNINGKILRKVLIEKPQAQNEVDIVEDPTFCEICGSNDNEDRLLLCDGCDLGFHLYCLTPPLDEVPEGAWFCNECSPHRHNYDVGVEDIAQLYDDFSDILRGEPGLWNRRRQQRSTR